MVVHSRDSHPETIRILEQEDAKNVLLHMFGGKEFIQQIVKNGWLVSVNYLVTRSKTYKKVARDLPLENLCLETDAPWNGVQKPLDLVTEKDVVFFKNDEAKVATLRNDPATIVLTAQKIAEIKGISFEEVWKAAGQNAAKFFGINV